MDRTQQMTRRRFLESSATALSLALVQGGSTHALEKGAFKKAVKFGMVRIKGSVLEKFQLLAELGFDGVEMSSPNHLDAKEVLKARDASGLTIHGVVDSVHWRDTLSDPDARVRQRGLAGLETALRDAKTYGASTVLLVPAVVNKKVAYDEAYRRSQEEVAKALPLAEKLGVKIALENVWNNFLISPLEMARYIDEFKSPFVGSYFDVGNVLRYGWPEQWIRILGKRILKVDIKEFSLGKANSEGLGKGFRVELFEGDCDWPAVMKALKEIGYTGWGTAEIPGGGRDRLALIARNMDRIFAS
jgi:L-ribulose-5-phosphate 3-epimerase